jgi:hypothetical protein
MHSSGAVKGDDERVLQFQITGTFALNMLGGLAHGAYIQAAVNPDTGRILDIGVTNRAMNLDALGPPLRLDPATQ